MSWELADLKTSTLALIVAGPPALLAIFLAAGRLRSPWRSLGRALAVFLLLRLVLLENPWIWSFYASTLRARHVGWRQMSVIREELRSVFRPPAGVRYLAVGSSQADAIFERYAAEHDDLRVFTMAGLFPLDFVLYRDRIEEFRPRVILLYLSEFDLARVQDPERIVLAPPQGLRLPELAWTVARLPGGDRYHDALVQMAFGQFLPEYRFGFVFRGLARKALGRNRFEQYAGGREDDRPAEAVDDPTAADSAIRQREIRSLRESMAAEQIDFNLPFLRSFLRATASWGSRVVILEGRCAPGMNDARTAQIHEIAVGRLRALADEFDNVHFVPWDRQPGFRDADWVDTAHVSREAGRGYAEEMIRRLQAAGFH